MRVTERDVATLRWIAEWWGTTVSQVDRWWRLPANAGLHGEAGPPRKDVVRRRLFLMARAELLAVHRTPTSPALVYSVTAAGLAAAGREVWTAPRWRWSQFHHEHTATSVALDLLEAGWQVVPERRMRQDDALGIASWFLVLPSETGTRTHYPDLWVCRHEGDPWRAVEVEISRKSLARLESILAAYRDRGAGVTYYTNDPGVRDAVKKVAKRAGHSDVDVRRVDVDARPVASVSVVPPAVPDPSLPLEGGPMRGGQA